MDFQSNCAEDVFSKFINKAKKKLSKPDEVKQCEQPQKSIEADYQFKSSNRKDSLKKLEAKIHTLLKDDPNAINPIEQLIDHTIYNKLPESSKQRYILQLSSEYNRIKNNITKSF